jgi:hydroxymethylbilane synthase
VRRIRLGTRGSTLALAQSGWVKEQILQQQPALEIELVVIKTGGDRFTEMPIAAFGGKGVFTKEIEDALLNHEIAPRNKSLDAPVPLEKAWNCSARYLRELGLIHECQSAGTC